MGGDCWTAGHLSNVSPNVLELSGEGVDAPTPRKVTVTTRSYTPRAAVPFAAPHLGRSWEGHAWGTGWQQVWQSRRWTTPGSDRA